MYFMAFQSLTKPNLLKRGLLRLRSYAEMVAVMHPDDDDDDQASDGGGVTTSIATTAPSGSSRSQRGATAAAACANAACRQSFTLLETPRACSMCKREFCKRCTAYRRRLSRNGDPDPLGMLYHVCRSCLELSDHAHYITDMTEYFVFYRDNRKKVAVVGNALPKPADRNSDDVEAVADRNSDDVEAVADRLAEGFLTSVKAGWVAGLVSDVVGGGAGAGGWQKATFWQAAGVATLCNGCQRSFSIWNRKVHCRLCGRVFCSDCSRQEMLLYVADDGGARWAVNGKEGGPASKPAKFETLPICDRCSTKLQSALLRRLTSAEADEAPDSSAARPSSELVVSDMVTLQSRASELQNGIEASLPRYLTLVELVDHPGRSAEQSAVLQLQHENPVHALCRLHCDLSQGFSAMSTCVTKLKALQPCTPAQSKLLYSIISAFSHYYTENICLFRAHNQRLSRHVTDESLVGMKDSLNERCMTAVHITLLRILAKGEGLSDGRGIFKHVMALLQKAEDICRQEFRAAFEKANPVGGEGGGGWGEQYENMKAVAQDGGRHGVMDDNTTRTFYQTFGSALSNLKSCRKTLLDKTTKNDFRKTKAFLEESIPVLYLMHTHYSMLHFVHEGLCLQQTARSGQLCMLAWRALKSCQEELQSLAVPLGCWEAYSSDLKAMEEEDSKQSPLIMPSGRQLQEDPLRDPTADLLLHPIRNPFDQPATFACNAQHIVSRCFHGVSSCAPKCLQTRANLKVLMESMAVTKKALILSKVHFILKELSFEGLKLMDLIGRQDATAALEPVVEACTVCEEELQEAMEEGGAGGGGHVWTAHLREIKESLSDNVRYYVERAVGRSRQLGARGGPATLYVFLCSCSVVMSTNILPYLETVTAGNDFRRVKEAVQTASEHLDVMIENLKSSESSLRH